MERELEFETLSGTIDAVLFANEENGYSIFRMRTSDLEDTDEVTVTGCLPLACCGEDVVVTGEWITHPTYGRQFKAEFAERHMPVSADVIFSFLSGGAIKGIGPATASLIVNKFGDRTLDIIENHPEKLAQVRGISAAKADEYSLRFREQLVLRRLLEYFCTNGVRPVIAMRMYRFYAENSFEVLQTNPYILCSGHIGARFDEADSLAEELGFSKECAERVCAAIIFELKHNLNNGHVFIPQNALATATSQLIRIDEEMVSECIEELVSKNELIRETVGSNTACYLPELYDAETGVAKRIAGLAGTAPKNKEPFETVYADICRETGARYSEEQKEILCYAYENSVVAVTGGPGTGKTYSLSAVLEMYDRMGIRTLLAAPTGRAAKRISELTGRDAMTIHRLLGARYSDDGERIVFSKNREDPLECNAVVLDECSMIDIVLFHALLSAMPDDARLILVGDADQLPPVGPGNVFSALIDSGIVKTIRLTRIFRQSENSMIVENAHMINKGVYPDLGKNTGDFFRLKRADTDSALQTICELCSSRLPQKMQFAPEDIQVISLSRKGELGIIRLNKELQRVLNPKAENKKEKAFGEVIFREGDRIMQVRNNYDIPWHDEAFTVSGIGIFNGDIGYIREIDNQNQFMNVDFDGKIATYGFDMLNELEHSWAVTVHKSQGSEFPAVVLAIGFQPKKLMTRGILYTAVTRAKNILIIVGNDQDAFTMIDNYKRSNRYSFLKTRMRSEKGKPGRA